MKKRIAILMLTLAMLLFTAAPVFAEEAAPTVTAPAAEEAAEETAETTEAPATEMPVTADMLQQYIPSFKLPATWNPSEYAIKLVLDPTGKIKTTIKFDYLAAKPVGEEEKAADSTIFCLYLIDSKDWAEISKEPGVPLGLELLEANGTTFVYTMPQSNPYKEGTKDYTLYNAYVASLESVMGMIASNSFAGAYYGLNINLPKEWKFGTYTIKSVEKPNDAVLYSIEYTYKATAADAKDAKLLSIFVVANEVWAKMEADKNSVPLGTKVASNSFFTFVKATPQSNPYAENTADYKAFDAMYRVMVNQKNLITTDSIAEMELKILNLKVFNPKDAFGATTKINRTVNPAANILYKVEINYIPYSYRNVATNLATVYVIKTEEWEKISAEDGPALGKEMKSLDGLTYVLALPQSNPYSLYSSDGLAFERLHKALDTAWEVSQYIIIGKK